ncbi:MAG TPA: hypothetical protein VJ891_02545 [Casimicrobiaceae bacterium]|nr:hypothetical protein [Casimicrobiaceae bacterium]
MNASLRRFPPLAAVLLLASAAFAQPLRVAPPPPMSGETAPIGPPVAQPPLPMPPPGTLTQSSKATEARGTEPPPSRWQDALNALDADLRLRLLIADSPPAAWLAGEMEKTDIASKVRHYTEARTAAPDERLYQATLATACLVPTRPQLAACEAMDRLADWARRDLDNGVPDILLADRARQRGELDEAASYVEEAAGAARFDDYWSQGAQAWWSYLRGLPLGVDPAVKAKAAANYASSRDLPWAPSLHALCTQQGTRVRTERMIAACAKLGDAMVQRGATYALRRAGAELAEVNAQNADARATARANRARILEATMRCAQVQPDFATELESQTASVRERGVEQFGAWASEQARDGEVHACERLAAK